MKKLILTLLMAATCCLSAGSQDSLFGASKFKEEVLEAEGIVLVDFHATWCGPCQMLVPEFDKAADRMKGEVKFISIDIAQDDELAREYQIKSIPSLLVFRNGKVIDKQIGYMKSEEIIEWLNTRRGA